MFVINLGLLYYSDSAQVTVTEPTSYCGVDYLRNSHLNNLNVQQWIVQEANLVKVVKKT